MATKWLNIHTTDVLVIPGYWGIVSKQMGESMMQQRESMRTSGWIEVLTATCPTSQTYVRGEGMERYGEETTVPGVSPASELDIFTKSDKPVRDIPCPRLAVGPIEKGTRCYLCNHLLDYYFERTPGDYVKICSKCVRDHLRYEAVPNGIGALRRRPDEEKFR
jgi:hypothetical protein